MKKIITITTVLALLTSITFGQSKTIADFDKKATGAHLFLYQSVIRVLNKDKNPDFNKLIKDLDYLKFIMTDSLVTNVKSEYKALESNLGKEGYAQLMTFDNKDYKSTVFEKEDNSGKTSWVAIFSLADRYGLFEMNGSLDPKYFSSISSLNIDKLQDMLPLDDMGIPAHDHPENGK